MAKYCVGIDLGGTFIKSALFDHAMKKLAERTSPTPSTAGPEGVVEVMAVDAAELIRSTGLDRGQVIGAGIGSPGPLDLQRGLVIAMPNIPGFDDFPIRDRLAQRLGIPAVLENDANAAALGEFLAGGGRHVSDKVLLTLGTGVGSGIVINKRLLHGAHGIGAELGHMVVEPEGEPCGCGQRGCLERYASATYMSQYAQRLIEAGRPSSLDEPLRRNGLLHGADICIHCRAGDAVAQEAWSRAVKYLAIGCVNICRILDPDRIVFGGGMAKAGADLLSPLGAAFAALHWSLTPPRTALVLAELGNEAGVIGAAGVAWEKFGTGVSA